MSDTIRAPELSEPVTLQRDHIRGRSDARVTLLEYGDYENPLCAAAHEIVRALEIQMPERVRFVFRHFPAASVHPHAHQAAEAAEAAGAQGQFWAMHTTMFRHQSDLRARTLLQWAKALRLDVSAFADALEKHAYLQNVRLDFTSGVTSGVSETPCFYINGVRHDGGWDFATLRKALLVLTDDRPWKPSEMGR